MLERAQPNFQRSFLPGPGAALGHPWPPYPLALGETGMSKMGQVGVGANKCALRDHSERVQGDGEGGVGAQEGGGGR